jgi:hypothetical protein
MITPDQRLLLFSAPTFDLPFGRRGILYPLEILVED